MAESSGPARSEPTRWSTTRTPAIGRGPLASPCITTPSTRRVSAPLAVAGGCARAATATSTAQRPANGRRRRRRALRGMVRRNSEVELPEIFGPQILEILFQLIGTELTRIRCSCWRARFVALILDLDRREQSLAREDRRGQAQRDGDGVRRPRVDLHDVVAAVDVQLRVVGVLLDASDLDAAERAAEPEDHVLAV